MDDRQRIEALAEEGKITREEADRLLGVLDEIDGTEQELNGVGEVAKAEGGNGVGGSSRAPAATGAAATSTYSEPAPASSVRPSGHVSGPGKGQTVEVKLLAGNLRIEVDPALDTPVANDDERGEVDLEKIDDGYRLGGAAAEGSVLERMVSRLSRRDVHLSVPEGWGVRLDMKAGDVSVRGPLAFLSGQLLAGDLDADELHGVDLTVKAGDVDFTLLLTDGQHRIQAVAGDLDLRLLPSSDVSVKARVNVGDLSTPEDWRRKARGLGYGVEHSLGTGRAAFNLELATGDLTIGTARG